MDCVQITATMTYDPEAPEYRPRLKQGHPFRTTTRFMRDDVGELMRDVYGFLMPTPHEKDAPKDWSRTPEERAAARRRAEAKAEEERKAIRRMARRIKKRQNIGDPDCVQSRDEDFPLLAVLRRDRRPDLIATVVAYRKLVALCEAEPLKGQAYGDGSANGINVERRSTLRDGVAEVDEVAKAGFKSTMVPGGEIAYRSELKRDQGAYDLPPRRVLAAEVNEDGTPVGGKTESLHIKINEDTLADYIDRKPILGKIRAALGPLLDPVEDALLGGQTFQAIGERDGFSGPQARSVGNALVMRGLSVVDGFLGAKKRAPENDNYLIEHRKIA